MGEHPSGYVLFTPQGRLSFTLTSGHRKPPESLEDKAALLSSVIAYTGTYRLDGDRWITQVDVAWNPEWVGTEQIRHFKIHGDQLDSHDALAGHAQLARQRVDAQHCSFSPLSGLVKNENHSQTFSSI